MLVLIFFFSSRRRHTRQESVSWARRCVQETAHEYPMNSRPSSDVLGTETRLMQIGEEEDEELKLHPEPVVNNSGLDKQNKDDEVNSGDNITSNIARDGEDKEPKRAGENYASK
eukprot:TRINITY_DN1424_c0_g1_i1.p1 TRINITY_DN1424_c0_g1~~TRINITY_DN1424_c0_g1_i1.p1  ORF type:complete len:114 (-),score=31.02 TRINITY_DN1424_c0_g1_i1:372-713(-)